MLDIEDIQAKASALIGAVSYLSGCTVLQDDGYQNDAAELARRTNGCVVVVRQPDALNISVQTAGASFGFASINVLVSVNQEVNQGDAGLFLDPQRMAHEVKVAMEAYDATEKCQYFSLASQSMQRTEGLHEHDLTFSAPCTA